MYIWTLYTYTYNFTLLRKFNKTIEILQGDIESLENDKQALERRLNQEAKKTMLADTTSLRVRPGRFEMPRVGERREDGALRAEQGGAALPATDEQASPLLLARVVCVCVWVGVGECVCVCDVGGWVCVHVSVFCNLNVA